MSVEWVTADLHLGHTKLINAEPARQRFADIEEHDRFIAAQWRERVAPHDIVYVLGDVAWNKRSLMQMRNWPGIKKLVLGNHDQLSMSTYLEIFRSVRAYRELTDDWGYDWLLAHVPVHPGDLVRWNGGQIHGHRHGNGSPPAVLIEPETGAKASYVSACVELHDFAPVKLHELIGGRIDEEASA